jgi:hypothetical protein
MAIQKTITVQHFGLVLENAYHRIDDIYISNKQVNFSIKTFVSKEARDNNAGEVAINKSGLSLETLQTFDGDDIIAKLYNFIKSIHPDFKEDTVDV